MYGDFTLYGELNRFCPWYGLTNVDFLPLTGLGINS